jgi:excisionase family DNA binding protein
MDSSPTIESNDGAPFGQLLLTAEQAATSLAICRTRVYELLRSGQLESIRIGTSRRIPGAALAEYVERLRKEQQGDLGNDLHSLPWSPTVLRNGHNR